MSVKAFRFIINPPKERALKSAVHKSYGGIYKNALLIVLEFLSFAKYFSSFADDLLTYECDMHAGFSVSQNEQVANLRDQLSRIESQIGHACQISGRDRQAVCLIAVTKTVPVSRIEEAYELGLRHFGESRLQEALPKIQALPADIHWHFIGKLQSNKLRRASESFEVIHSIESQSQLKEIAKLDSPITLLIEVNIGEESEKSGVFEQELTKFHSSVIECKQANFRGLMAIGPNLESAESMRPYFRKLRELNQKVGGEWLSMGMSSDFEVAIQEGATHIRIGSALFGER